MSNVIYSDAPVTGPNEIYGVLIEVIKRGKPGKPGKLHAAWRARYVSKEIAQARYDYQVNAGNRSFLMKLPAEAPPFHRCSPYCACIVKIEAFNNSTCLHESEEEK